MCSIEILSPMESAGAASGPNERVSLFVPNVGATSVYGSSNSVRIEASLSWPS